MTHDVYRIEGLNHLYGSFHALSGVSAVVRAGEVLGIVGPNGAGKTTLLKILCGFLKPTSGEVHFHGKLLRRWKHLDLAQRVAYVPQQTNIVFPYTARDVVLMGRLPHQEGRFFETRSDLEAVEHALDLTGSAALRDRYFNDLSGGERQLVVLASALAQEPEVLLLDEPTIFLDLRHQLAIYRILADLHRDRRMTLVVVTHDLNLAESFCERILFVNLGTVVAELARAESESSISISPELIEQVFDVKAATELIGDTRRIVLSFGQ
jgi:iron complex transport system ATP-binding protein